MLTITLPEEFEEPLYKRAKQKGMTPAAAAVELLRQGLELPVTPASKGVKVDVPSAALSAIRRGKYVRASSPGEPLASDRFAAEKAEELAREERRRSA